MSFSMDLFRLDGKVAIVTGANHDLGESYAVALAKAGIRTYEYIIEGTVITD